MAHSLHKLIKEFNLYGFLAPGQLARSRERQKEPLYGETPYVSGERPNIGGGANIELIKLDSLAYSSMPLAKDRKPPQKPELPPDAGLRGVSPTDPIFDRWLERKLHELFDAVAHEPIPDDLIQLIVTLDQKDRKG